MIDDDVNQQLRILDDRLARVEQFLPSVATKDDLAKSRLGLEAVIATLATKDDLTQSRRELDAVIATLATKDDLKDFAKKDDLTSFATKEDLKAYATKEDMRDEAERTRRHFDVVAESLRDEIRLALEGNMGVTSRVETLEHRYGRLERRVTVLDVGGTKRKK